jgi:hypothetical protein
MTHEECTASTLDNEALAAYRAVANGLRHCLDMADIGAEYGHTWHAAEYETCALRPGQRPSETLSRAKEQRFN